MIFLPGPRCENCAHWAIAGGTGEDVYGICRDEPPHPHWGVLSTKWNHHCGKFTTTLPSPKGDPAIPDQPEHPDIHQRIDELEEALRTLAQVARVNSDALRHVAITLETINNTLDRASLT